MKIQIWLVIQWPTRRKLGVIRTSSSEPEVLAEQMYPKPFYLRLKKQ